MKLERKKRTLKRKKLWKPSLLEVSPNQILKSIESSSQLKDKVHGFSKAKIMKLLFTVMDECETITIENCLLKDVCFELKRDVRMLERSKLELEHVNEILKCEKLKVEEKTLA